MRPSHHNRHPQEGPIYNSHRILRLNHHKEGLKGRSTPQQKGRPIHSTAVAKGGSHHTATPQQEAASTATQEAAPIVTPQKERRGHTYSHPTAEEKSHTYSPQGELHHTSKLFNSKRKEGRSM